MLVLLRTTPKGHAMDRTEPTNQAERRRLLIEALLSERDEQPSQHIPADAKQQRALLRALMNIRPPRALDADLLSVQDTYLTTEIDRRGIVDAASIPSLEPSDPVRARMHLWRGDITRLAADAIMNAANSQMLGCFVPGHHCIDNAIHTYAGMQLRLACAELMDEQGHDEPTGRVKVTPGFNLPCRYVLHTVGPIVPNRSPLPRHASQLRSCYRSCLEAATNLGCETLAVCCLSTGIFGYPPHEAARIALEEVTQHLADTDSALHVIFDVFSEADERIYRELASDGAPMHR